MRVDPHAGKIVINRMTSQSDRAVRAPAADVDARSLAEVLASAPSVAKLVRFAGLDNCDDGDWRDFFLGDSAVVLASMCATDARALEVSFAKLVERTRDARSFESKLPHFNEALGAFVVIARLLDGWLLGLENASSAGAVRAALAAQIEDSLSLELRAVEGYARGAALHGALGHPVAFAVEGLSAAWGSGHAGADEAVYRGHSRAQKIDHAVGALVPRHAAFGQAIAGLGVLARASFDGALVEGNKQPHLALWLAFAQLFQTAQNTLNRFSGRYVSFYYDEVLREAPRGAVGDRAYVAFSLEDGAEPVHLGGQTRLSAGADAKGVEIVMATERSLRVSPAKLERVRALRVLSTNVGGRAVAEQVLATEVPGDDGTPPSRVPGHEGTPPSRVPGRGPQAAATTVDASQGAWPLFGDGEGTTPASRTAPATLGFAISSGYLGLQGGARTIEVWLRFTRASMDAARPWLEARAQACGLAVVEVLEQLLEAAFFVELTTPKGWLSVDAVEALVADDVLDGLEVGLRLVLSPEAPPIAPIDAAVLAKIPAGGDSVGVGVGSAERDATIPSRDLPSLKAYLRSAPVELQAPSSSSEAVYPLVLLGLLEPEAVWLRVEVSGLAGVTLATAAGPVHVDKPFLLLGPAPTPGAYLEVRHRELFDRRLDRLSLAIDWFDLPPNDTGFRGRYRYYDLGLEGVRRPGFFDNRVFTVGVSLERAGRWDFANEHGNEPLFRTNDSVYPPLPDPAAKVAGSTVFDAFIAAPRDDVATDYDAAKSSIRVTLASPAEGFGDSVYAANVLDRVTRATPDPARCQALCQALVRPLDEGAELLRAGLELCGDKVDAGACRRCFDSSLEVCRQALYTSLVSVMANGVRSGEADLELAIVQRLDDDAEAEKAAAPEDARHALFAWVRDYRAAFGDAVGSTGYIATELLHAIDQVDRMRDAAHGTDSLSDYQAQMAEAIGALATELESTSAASLSACVDACSSSDTTIKYPAAPWVPQARAVTVGYSASCLIAGAVLASADQAAMARSGALFDLLPFGGARERSVDVPSPWLSTPSFEGALYLGFSRLEATSTLSLLMHLDATGTPESAGPVRWTRSLGGGWSAMPVSTRHDATRGLQRTGVIALDLPSTTAEGAEPLEVSSELGWLRASVDHGAGAFPRCLGVHPNAVVARWQDNGNTGEHLAAPLPAGSIKKLIATGEQPPPSIKTIEQPLASFGGRAPESRATIPTRLAERLRHKDRAVIGWDYDRLVLERFSSIERTRTLPARGPNGPTPGAVTVVVLNAHRASAREPFDPVEPAVADDVLEEIGASLEAATSPFVALHVVNPIYVRQRVIATIEVSDDEDPDAAAKELNDELVAALSPSGLDAPWAQTWLDFPTEDDIAELIRTRPYVTALLDLRCELDPDPASLDWYFLTSASAHDITATTSSETDADTTARAAPAPRRAAE
jgi:hypothetical protein